MYSYFSNIYRKTRLKLERLPWNFILLMSFIAFTYLNLMLHTPWLDEAQSWMIARDVPLKDLMAMLRYEGHPPLFYLLIMPFAKLGATFFAAEYINWIATVGAAAVLIYKCKLPFWFKFFFLFSFGFSIWTATFARSYGLMALLLFSLCALYPKRMTYPKTFTLLIGLLINTHVFGVVPAACFGLMLAYDLFKARSKQLFLVIPIALLFMIPAFYPVLFVHPTVLACTPKALHNPYELPVDRVVFNMFPTKVESRYYDSISGIYLAFIYLLTLFVLWPSKRGLILGATSLFTLTYYFNFINSTSWQRQSAFYFAFILLGLWMTYRETDGYRKVHSAFRRAFYCYIILLSATVFIQERFFYYKKFLIVSNSSESIDMASFITDRKLTDKPIVLFPTPMTLSVSLFLPDTKVFHLDAERYATYITWDLPRCGQNKPEIDPSFPVPLMVLMYKHFPDRKAYVIIPTMAARFMGPLRGKMKQLYTTINDALFMEESFTLYEWDPGTAVSPPSSK